MLKHITIKLTILLILLLLLAFAAPIALAQSAAGNRYARSYWAACWCEACECSDGNNSYCD